MAVTDDIGVYYAVFGVSATWTHGGTATPVSVIFDRNGAVSMVGDIEYRNASPQARVQQSNVPSVVQGDTLAVLGTTYNVTDVEPINNDEYVLHLSKD